MNGDAPSTPPIGSAVNNGGGGLTSVVGPLALVAVVLGILLIQPMNAEATWSYTAYRCAAAGCKYGKYRAAYDSYAHREYWHVGATASGTCDPTNDIVQWRVSETRTYEDSVLKYTAGPFGWHTNCALLAYLWTVTVPRDYAVGLMQSRAHFEWDAACGGCDFDELIWTSTY